MSYIDELGKKAKTASKQSAVLSQTQKNDILSEIASMLENSKEEIKAANALDIEAAKSNNMAAAMVDRLTLTDARIDGMAEGVTQVAALADPVGRILGGGLINAVIKNATVPVIQTGEGNCHVYVDRFADIDMAVNIVDNAKTQRPSVCNAIENVLVHKNIAEGFLRKLAERWNGKVAFVGDEASAAYITLEKIADDEDYRKEFLDLKIAVKIVDDIDEAIAHINRFGTGHSECIVTEYLKNAEKFQREIDAAAVYVNASTRFTDGFEFGLGAEIGISTQKLHVRGPMGLEALTTFKYLINGNGQIRG